MFSLVIRQVKIMQYAMIMPEPFTRPCSQQGTYVEPLTTACGSE